MFPLLQESNSLEDDAIEKKLSDGVIAKDIVVGNGPKAEKNSKITLFFDCRLHTSDEIVMSSGEKPFVIELGSKNTLKGWNIGLKGVSCGSKRRVTCPPKSAYGAFGYPPHIPADATLTYTFTIISVEPQKKGN